LSVLKLGSRLMVYAAPVGLGAILGAIILLSLHYKFELKPGTAFIFFGFGFWAIFLAVVSE
jgi:hypothetical protein